MQVIISQMRLASAPDSLPLLIHHGYPVETHCGEMFTARPGYEIAAVYINVSPNTDSLTGGWARMSDIIERGRS